MKDMVATKADDESNSDPMSNLNDINLTNWKHIKDLKILYMFFNLFYESMLRST
jgi:hypothetical protein